MKYKFMTSLLLLSQLATAETLKGKVHAFIPGEDGVDSLLLLENGRVVFVQPEETKLLYEINEENVEIEINQKNELQKMKKIYQKSLSIEDESSLRSAENTKYEPTILSSVDEVNSIFKELNPRYSRRSSAQARSMVWASEEFKKKKLRSMKAFILFTIQYIRKYRFNWWYHLAPMSLVKEGNTEPQKWVLDFRYAPRPLNIKDWTDIFVFSKRSCLETNQYSTYQKNTASEDCYLMYRSMYSWDSKDLVREERDHVIRKDFSLELLKQSYQEAF